MKSLTSLTLGTTLLLAALATGAGDASSAGSGDHSHDHDQGHAHAEAIGSPGDPAAVDRTIEVVMHDNYYEPERVSVAAGETVRFQVVNAGSLVHEFNIGTAAMHAAHQQEMQMMVERGVLEADQINHDMMNKDMGSGHMMAHDDPNSVLLEPGARGDVIWRFSKEADLEFACNVPGHYEAGMVGEIEVE